MILRNGKEFELADSFLDDCIGPYMDDDIRERVHGELAPCTPEEFLRRYVELEPGFKDFLWNELRIDL